MGSCAGFFLLLLIRRCSHSANLEGHKFLSITPGNRSLIWKTEVVGFLALFGGIGSPAVSNRIWRNKKPSNSSKDEFRHEYATLSRQPAASIQSATIGVRTVYYIGSFNNTSHTSTEYCQKCKSLQQPSSIHSLLSNEKSGWGQCSTFEGFYQQQYFPDRRVSTAHGSTSV